VSARAAGLLSAVLLIGTIGTAAAQDTLPLGRDVRAAYIAAGRDLFHGVGGCNTCHGERGAGSDEAPALLGGARWERGNGDFDWLVHMTQHAGWGMRGRGDDARPMRGPTGLESAQVHRVAAYVWSISREKPPAAPTP
jgi:mono/diheme cytochrome c family protein